MFPEKIKIIDEYIDLIVQMRKENNITAYQLSEMIGKNKSWLPNIENRRTKNISKNDFLLIFNNFAKDSGLSTEHFIIKNLSPNALIELDDDTTVPCFYLQNTLKLYPKNFTKASVEEHLQRFDYYSSEKPMSIDVVTINERLVKFSNTILEELPYLVPDDRAKLLKALEIMRQNFVNDFNITRSFYEVPIMHGGTNQFGKNISKQFISNLDIIHEKYISALELSYSKATVYAYFDKEPYEKYEAVHLETYTGNNPNDMIMFISSIESYIYELYRYIRLAISDAVLNNYECKIEYHKLYSVASHVLQRFIKIAKIDYSFQFEIPFDDASKDEIDKKQLELNNISYAIKQAFNKKYEIDV